MRLQGCTGIIFLREVGTYLPRRPRSVAIQKINIDFTISIWYDFSQVLQLRMKRFYTIEVEACLNVI
jgi:hypothetical protein